jgi:hypothetical protein
MSRFDFIPEDQFKIKFFNRKDFNKVTSWDLVEKSDMKRKEQIVDVCFSDMSIIFENQKAAEDFSGLIIWNHIDEFEITKR